MMGYAAAKKTHTPELLRAWAQKANASRTPEQKREYARLSYEATTPEQRRAAGERVGRFTREMLLRMSPADARERMRKVRAAFPYEKRREMMLHARLLADQKPNTIEDLLIRFLEKHHIFAQAAAAATVGQVYYADVLENRIFIRLTDGTHKVCPLR